MGGPAGASAASFSGAGFATGGRYGSSGSNARSSASVYPDAVAVGFPPSPPAGEREGVRGVAVAAGSDSSTHAIFPTGAEARTRRRRGASR